MNRLLHENAISEADFTALDEMIRKTDVPAAYIDTGMPESPPDEPAHTSAANDGSGGAGDGCPSKSCTFSTLLDAMTNPRICFNLVDYNGAHRGTLPPVREALLIESHYSELILFQGVSG